ncbi:Mannan endo-1,4-beta-mannosidase (plasmid) [Haloterrigena turkmenica DSM 5511]|uniref:mannan endo-1,4-beta-mannosidase n=1 Tax=Haloterrigena turkmenica (strain ATCC 51198 / DSM 5511 / JCM 9101 / NCIMB 13204 / VKM B-1734 / 4k) TaxID=543526 RepID=D2S259_HALTV|nr:cellulase family glycosylhydrolase [Haloterrigena turkmenica]ADB63456.1 Mannan endo-1,4-beta-mannosidase [Haloterrigena turkmenica DSM 5511]
MVRRRTILCSGGAVASGLTLPGFAAPASDEASNRPDGFLATDRTSFSVDGESQYLAGTNNFWLADVWTTRDEVDTMLDRATDLGLNTVRTWAFCAGRNGHCFQPSEGEYDESAFEHLDYVIEAAADRGLRLILPLANNWGAYGGMEQYVEWSETAEKHDDFYTDLETRQLYRDFVETVVTRTNSISGVPYAEDTTIAMWELGNEPRAQTKGVDVLGDWIEEMSGFIKRLDPNHLVSTGMEGFYDGDGDDWLRDGSQGTAYVDHHRIDTVDACSFHLYPDHWGVNPEYGTEWIEDHVRDGHERVGKPVYLGEFGIQVDRNASDARQQIIRRNSIYDTWYDRLDELDADGGVVWQLTLKKRAPYDDGFYVFPGDDRTIRRIERFANRMDAESGRPLHADWKRRRARRN